MVLSSSAKQPEFHCCKKNAPALTDALCFCCSRRNKTPSKQLLCRARFGHRAIETRWLAWRVRIDKVNPTIDDLIGTNRCPVDHVGRAFDVEPSAVRARGANVKEFARQQTRCRTGRPTVQNDRRCRCRTTDQIVGSRSYLQDDRTVQIGRAIILWHHGNGCLTLAGRNQNRA